MNKIEQYVYERVRFHPRLKRWVVDAYQRTFSLFPSRPAECVNPITVREGYFYGFHDKCPWSPDNRMLLAHRFDDPLRMPGPEDEVEVGYFSGKDYSDFRAIGRTRSWNWQQGSMLQWVGNSTFIMYNDFDGGKHIAKIVDQEGNLVRTLAKPAAALAPDGRHALSYSFARLQRYARAYGYANGTEPEQNVAVPTEDGLYIIDVSSGRIQKLFSVAEIVEVQWDPSMKNCHHYFTHCLFSPSGNRFVFFHRWVTARGVTWTRMVSCDADGGNVFIFPTNGIVTHVAWWDDRAILAYGSTEEFGSHYYVFQDRSGQFSILGRGRFTSDGHPQFSPEGKRIITDTYPNRSRLQSLILYEIETDRRIELARVRSPFEYRGDLRCDLHPRWDREGTMICFDAAYTGVRALCTMRS